jgi:hypothetical protein
MEYKRFLGMRYNTSFKVNPTALWQSTTVKRVLTNAVYIGTLEQGKRSKPNYKVRKAADVPKEQWICKENAHDPIIDRRTFDTVQQLLKLDTRVSDKTGNVFPLSGVILCGDCGGAMLRKNYKKKDGSPDPFYVCGKHRADISVCSTHLISATDVENAVLKALRLHITAVLDMEKALACAENMAYRQDGVRKLTARVEAKQDEIKKFKDYRLSLHESYRDNIISREDFVSFKSTYDEKIVVAETAVASLKEEIEKLAAGEAESHDWINKFRENIGIKTLERKTVAELIDCVNVFEGGRIKVRFRYYNEFERMLAAKEAA